ncbi:MAG TPA: tetratricopeptide repeat protein [Ktedonobacteraceae bacterium]|nr:tetratricopeptide repeat protein [Ktedonobacteraceae bacterium]
MELEDKYIGKQIGNYRITAALNSGAFGRIYQGTHLYLTNRIVAIKLLHLTYLGSQEERESFLQEAQFLEILKHPHILPIYDVGIHDGFPYLIAEFASNGSLRDRLQHTPSGLLPLDESLRILAQVGQALQFVHEQNIVHRDLKPENILFNAKSDAMIADFGIAVFLDNTKTKYVDVIGSPLYMAPEQFEGIASRRSDQYALACIAYELLTGEPPFVAAHAVTIGLKHQTEPPRQLIELNPDIPEHIEQAVLKALSKNREDRYADTASFITALLTIPTGPVRKTKEQLLAEGNRLFNGNRYAEALVAFERAIQLSPSFTDAYEGRGSALYALGRTKEALAAYEQALQLDANYIPAYMGKGNILYDLKHYEDAFACYEQASQLNPTLVDAYVGLGNTLYYLGDYEQAIVAYKQAIDLDHACIAAYDGRAWALLHLKHYKEAVVSFERAIHLDHNNPSPYVGKGKSLYSLGHFEDALVSFNQAIMLDPDHLQAHEGKADALYHLKQYEDALAAYEQVLTLVPDFAYAHDRMGWTLWHLRRYEEALEPFEHAIKLDAHLASPHNGKGRVYYDLKRYKEALASYEYALLLNPNLATAHNGKGNVLADLHRYEEALEAYNQAIRLQPRTPAFHQNKGDVLKQFGRLKEAQQEYEMVHHLSMHD